MNWLGLDVGKNTGIVVAHVEPRLIPVIRLSRTVDLGLRDKEYFRSTIKEQIRAFAVQGVVVEYPLDDRHAFMGSDTREAKRFWQNLVVDWSDSGMTIVEVQPGTWKRTPSGGLNVFKVGENGISQREYRPSQHEKDAACLLHWFSFFYKGQ